MKKLFARAAASLSGRYRTMSIQMVISLSFTVAAVAGMVLMGLSLVWRYSAGTEQLVRENTERVLGQVNMNMDSYLRRMMRVSDTMYYRIIKNADLATQSLDEGMELLYEENRDELVSIAVFDSRGALVAGTPLTALKEGRTPPPPTGIRRRWTRWRTCTFPPPTSSASSPTRTRTSAGWCR